jgi:hypothetical protein
MKNRTKRFFIISIVALCLIGMTTAQSRIPNPERGLRFEGMARVPGLQFPWDVNRILNPKTWCKDLEPEFDATDGHVRVSQLYIYLTDFASTDVLSQSALDAVQTLFDGVREQGYKIVLRFAYTYDGPGGYVYPPMNRILNHLNQLKPIIQANIDVIYVLQSGIIGLWGEWHNYNNVYTQTDKNNLLKKLLEILPQNRQTMMRNVGDKNNANLSPEQKSRIGYHNDFFTDNKHVNYLSWGYFSTTTYTQVQAESPNVMVEGEMPYEGPTDTDYLRYVLDPIQSIKQFRDHRYNTFSLTHNYPVTFAGWKNMYLSKGQMDQYNFPYSPEFFKNGSRTVYDYVADHLGYRLYVDHEGSSVADNGSQLTCKIKLINYGFSALHNPREVYLVLTNCTNEVVNLVQVNSNPSTWHTGVDNSLSGIIPKPANLTNYKIGLWMPDYEGSKTKYDPRYAIRICNTNSQWEEVNYGIDKKIGMNVLAFSTCASIVLDPDTCVASCSDRGSVQTTSSHKWFQILDQAGDPITKYITGSSFTFETWFYLDDMSKAKGMLFYINNGMQFGFSPNEARLLFQNPASGRTVDVWLDYTSLPEFSDLTAGKWIHLALVVDGNNWKVYMDGTERYNQTLAGGYRANTTNFLIGGDWWGNFQGKLAETRVWNSARTASEIADNRRKILPIATPTLISRVNFGEGSGEKSVNLSSVGGNAWASAGGASINWGLVSERPANLRITDITSTSFTLTWDGGTETEYLIELTNASTSVVNYFSTSSKSYTFTNLLAANTYKVKVMSSKPLETGYSVGGLIPLLTTTGMNVNQTEGIEMHTGESYWQIHSRNGHSIRAKVYNLSGTNVGEFFNSETVNINHSNFAKGMYIIKVYTVEGESVCKIIK